MAKRAVGRSYDAEVTPGIVTLAERRTEFLFFHMRYGRGNMTNTLASAYLQGMNDMFDALEKRGYLKQPRNTAEQLKGTQDE